MFKDLSPGRTGCPVSPSVPSLGTHLSIAPLLSAEALEPSFRSVFPGVMHSWVSAVATRTTPWTVDSQKQHAVCPRHHHQAWHCATVAPSQSQTDRGSQDSATEDTHERGLQNGAVAARRVGPVPPK